MISKRSSIKRSIFRHSHDRRSSFASLFQARAGSLLTRFHFPPRQSSAGSSRNRCSRLSMIAPFERIEYVKRSVKVRSGSIGSSFSVSTRTARASSLPLFFNAAIVLSSRSNSLRSIRSSLARSSLANSGNHDPFSYRSGSQYKRLPPSNA